MQEEQQAVLPRREWRIIAGRTAGCSSAARMEDNCRKNSRLFFRGENGG